MNRLVGLVLVVALGAALLPLMYAAAPSGGSITEQGNETAPADTAGSQAAIAGNISEIDITAYTTTQTWQGYFGNVSGTIQLADANDNVLYNWSLASPEGEVYASVFSNISWGTIHCFNFTATGTGGVEAGVAGNTSQTGWNLTIIEEAYGLASDDVDGVNETFDLTGSLANNDGTHDLFYTNSLDFTAGECLSTNPFYSTDTGADNFFEEVLLFDSTNQIPVFASLLEEADTAGFDGNLHDFEMLVLEDGHGTDTSVTTYYFYVELE